MKALVAWLLQALAWLVFALLVAGFEACSQQLRDGDLRVGIEQSLEALEGSELDIDAVGVSLDVLEIDVRLKPYRIASMLERDNDYEGVLVYSTTGAENYAMSAQGVDRGRYLVNTFLEGYQPFAVDNIALPLYVLAQRKTYMLDADQYANRPEVWQSSREAFLYTRGDCEDHAIALADWLIEMGEDARVVLGDHAGEGHAWVVLFRNGQEFLLESTQKSGVGRNRPYPLAKLHTEYRPQFMFNRSYFWANQGSKYTTSYSGSQWARKSRYNRPESS